jgi:kinesin family protein C2/C3
VENQAHLQCGESQPLPAFQYFENVRNFLVAIEELKLPAFEASDLERVGYLLYSICMSAIYIYIYIYICMQICILDQVIIGIYFSQDALEAGSVAKVVDCILALKSYHEWKQMGCRNGFYKNVKSPLVMHSASRTHTRASATTSLDSCRRLDMSGTSEKQPPFEGDNQKLEG